MIASPALAPTTVLLDPEVKAVRASLPIAVLFPPETEASKALSPRTVLPETEFTPLPIVIEFMVASLLVTVKPSPSIFTISVELETKPISPEPLL